MSIDINWETLTSGPDGLALAEQIRDFIHDKFQQVPLPRFIQSVAVHKFEFGDIAPDVELKDICEPLSDFYEDGLGEEDEGGDPLSDEEEGEEVWRTRRRREGDEEYMSSSRATLRDRRGGGGETLLRSATTYPINNTTSATTTSISMSLPHISPPPYLDPRLPTGFRTILSPSTDIPPFLGRSPTPIVPGGTSTLNHYFHSPLTTGLSGTQTPLAAVAGAHLPSGWLEHSATITGSSGGEGSSGTWPQHHYEHDNSASVSPPSTANSTSAAQASPPAAPSAIPAPTSPRSPSPASTHRRRRAPRPSDFQVIARVRYAGNVALSLTASILLDYPMPSFVSIPCKLNITGLTFDGVAVLAFVRKRNMHFCFLAPEDAAAMTGVEDGKEDGVGGVGGLLREVKVESEIGQREGGKQVLKNVGKVEKFVLEQVRRIFEEEFVYPSFWTFLV